MQHRQLTAIKARQHDRAARMARRRGDQPVDQTRGLDLVAPAERLDDALHVPVLFTSPLFTDSNTHATQNYDRIAFEVDLPRIEFVTNPACQRHLSNPADPSPGSGCVNPPAGAGFYPLFTTRGGNGSCTWQLGGTNNPGTKETFGGTSTAEFGPLLALAYPAPNGVTLIFNDFRQILSSNPCPSRGNIASLD